MSLNVEQDSASLRSIAEEIRGYAAKIHSDTGLIEAAMDNRLSEAPGDSFFWYGPKAGQFKTDFQAKYPEKFANAYNNIISMAENLESQAQQWETFEGQ